MADETSLSLFVTHPTGERTEYLLKDGLKVGRLAEADVRVMSPYLSRIHFIIRRTADGFEVESQHQVTASSSGTGGILGTYVNKELVAGSRPIKAGDRISPKPDPGPDDLVFEVGPTQSPTPADQLPKPPAGLNPMAVGVVVLILIGAILFFLIRS